MKRSTKERKQKANKKAISRKKLSNFTVIVFKLYSNLFKANQTMSKYNEYYSIVSFSSEFKFANKIMRGVI